ERVVSLLTQVDKSLASQVGEALGITPKKPEPLMNKSVPADADPKKYQPKTVKQAVDASAALSMANTIKNTIKTRQVAILAANGVDDAALNQMKKALEAEGAMAKVIAPMLGNIKGIKGSIKADATLFNTASVLFDAVYIPGGAKSVATLQNDAQALLFINEAYKHCKAIAAEGEAVEMLKATYADSKDPGVITGKGKGSIAKNFINAIAQHRFWERESGPNVPA
ncbi:MAG: DJ-1/PfpI family protein, partial [Bacteroidetes bacterium]|nr:DJ-1/PfpI family protein [Bacteroidota bacterium]